MHNDFIKDMGYDVLIIWESEWLTDREKTISKCLEFLKLK